jgi:ribosome-associated translation inhibitor RaiA
MKISISYHLIQPSLATDQSIARELATVANLLQIDEARVDIQFLPEESPAYAVRAHLVTPGPDIFASGRDHTLGAAIKKMIGDLELRIIHRRHKQVRRKKPETTGRPAPEMRGSRQLVNRRTR